VKVTVVVPQPRARRFFKLLLLLVGLVCLGIYSYSYLYRTAYQIYEGWQFDHDKTTEPAEEKSVALPVVLPDPDRGVPSSKRQRLGIVGRISIPRLNVSAMVEEGIDDLTLSRAVGHIPGTPLPGESGNVGIAGHRDTFFRALKDLQPHDSIEVATRSGHFRYSVVSLTVVEPDNVGVLASYGGHSLTIVTCFPFQYIGNAPRRFIVHAISD
jgi:LPXTG-site transpeptidase (sortase) family protein